MSWTVESYKVENIRLIKIMDRKGYNVRKLSAATGISDKALHEIIKGRSFPRLDTLLLICHTLQTSIDSIYPIEL